MDSSDEGSDGEGAAEEEEDEERLEDDGRYSPEPEDPKLMAGQDIIHEEEDYRQLALPRQTVLLMESTRYKAGMSGGARATCTTEVDCTSQGILAVQGRQLALLRQTVLLKESSRYKAGTSGGAGGRGAAGGQYASHRAPRNLGGRGVHPMMRNLAAEEDEEAASGSFRTGRGPKEEDLPDNDQTLASFKMQSVPLESQVYWWHEKYKPRKPKYFNRVHTGYEWNKYNQTHYDSDNPPHNLTPPLNPHLTPSHLNPTSFSTSTPQ
eukprot:gene32163-16697_t